MSMTPAVRDSRAYFCLDCGKCTGICPVSSRDSDFSPRAVVYGTVSGNGEDEAERMKLCLTCKLCSTVCPSAVRYSEFTQMRRGELRGNGSAPQCSHGEVLQDLMRLMARKGVKQSRLDWVPEQARTAEKGKLLYFTGCLPYYDAYFTHLEADTLSIARDTLRVLNALGEEPVLMKDEICCGHDLYWSGEEDDAARLAVKNVAAIRATGAERIVSACPECVQMIREVWPRLAGPLPFQAQHLSEYLEEKRQAGELDLEGLEGSVSFHDPCRLSRFLDAPEAPRGALGEIYGEGLKEMEHSGKQSICCGTSGWMHCNVTSRQIQVSRLQEAVDAGAETLVTACPKCQIHLRCAQAGEEDASRKNLPIRDFASVVAEALNGGDGSW